MHILYCFWSNLLHSLIGLYIIFINPQNLHLLFTCHFHVQPFPQFSGKILIYLQMYFIFCQNNGMFSSYSFYCTIPIVHSIMDMILTFIFHIFFCSSERSWYFLNFLFSFTFAVWFASTVTSGKLILYSRLFTPFLIDNLYWRSVDFKSSQCSITFLWTYFKIAVMWMATILPQISNSYNLLTNLFRISLIVKRTTIAIFVVQLFQFSHQVQLFQFYSWVCWNKMTFTIWKMFFSLFTMTWFSLLIWVE